MKQVDGIASRLRRACAGTLVCPRKEILLDGFVSIGHSALGTVIAAPSSFAMSDEVAVEWPDVGIVIHNIDALLAAPSLATAVAARAHAPPWRGCLQEPGPPPPLPGVGGFAFDQVPVHRTGT